MEALTIPREEAVRLGAIDDEFFNRTFFPRSFRLPSPPFARAISQRLADPKSPFVNIRCFRGSAKTTRLRAFSAKRIAYRISRTVLYIGASEAHAVRSIAWIRNQIERNVLFASTFGLELEKKSETELRVHSTIDDSHSWILGVGITGNIRGINFDDYRPDLIILDDPLTDENTTSDEQREKINTLIMDAIKNSLISRVEEPNAKMAVLQTPMHPKDACSLMVNDPEFVTETFGCWTPQTAELPVDEQESSWPEMYPSKDLRQKKLFSIQRNKLFGFLREWECKLSTPALMVFRPNWLTYRDEPFKGPVRCLGIDPVPPPSDSERERGLIGKHFEAHVVFGREGPDYHLCEYAINRGHEPNWSVTKCFELALRHRVRAIIIESVAYQRTLKWLIEQEMKRRGIYFVIVPAETTAKKYNRIIDAYSGIASQGHLIVSPQHTEFIQQFEEYKGQDPDDLLDAGAMALRHLINPLLELGSGDYKVIEDEYEPLRKRQAAP